jgi:hypothetical protein
VPDLRLKGRQQDGRVGRILGAGNERREEGQGKKRLWGPHIHENRS